MYVGPFCKNALLCPGVVDVRVSVNSNEFQTEQSALVFWKFQLGIIGQGAKAFVAPSRYVHPNRIIEFCCKYVPRSQILRSNT
jgi:hypothetical protein